MNSNRSQQHPASHPRPPRTRGHWLPLLSLTLGLVLAGGCASKRTRAYTVSPETAPAGPADQARQTLANLYPASYRATQRAIVTVRKREFVCDGVLSASPDAGHHLAVVSALGLVAELKLTPDRRSELVKVSPLLRESWSRDFVARDLGRLFAPRPDLVEPARLPDGRLALQTRPTPDRRVVRYIFNPDGSRWQEIEVERDGWRIYHVQVGKYRAFPGFAREVPAEFDVVAPAYRLNLRTVQMTARTADSAAK